MPVSLRKACFLWIYMTYMKGQLVLGHIVDFASPWSDHFLRLTQLKNGPVQGAAWHSIPVGKWGALQGSTSHG